MRTNRSSTADAANSAIKNASYAERLRFIRDLKSSLAHSPDALELRQRLSWRGDGPYARCYTLPYNLILLRDGFRLGEPDVAFAPGYALNQSLRPSRLRDVPPAVVAERAVAERLRELAADPDAPTNTSGVDWKMDLRCELGETFKPVVRVLTAPLWGSVWLMQRLLATFAPR